MTRDIKSTTPTAQPTEALAKIIEKELEKNDIESSIGSLREQFGCDSVRDSKLSRENI